MVNCDGCSREFDAKELTYHAKLGHIMRYCAECADIWVEFVKACEAEGARQNRLLDLWEIDMRKQLPLKLTPLDLPRLLVNRNGREIVLG